MRRRRAVAALLLGILKDYEQRSSPFSQASGASYPELASATTGGVRGGYASKDANPERFGGKASRHSVVIRHRMSNFDLKILLTKIKVVWSRRPSCRVFSSGNDVKGVHRVVRGI